MAYTEAVVKGVEANADGSQRLNLVFVGDAAEPPVPDTLTVSVSVVPDQDFLRRYAINKITTLNATKTFKGLIVTGQVIDTTTPLPTTTVDAARLDWQDKHLTYVAAQKAVAFGYEPQTTLDAAKDAATKAYKSAFLIYLRNA